MSNGLVLPTGAQGPGSRDGNSVPPGMNLVIAPDGYRDKFCPYQSGIWGGPAVISSMVGKGMVEQTVITPHGHSYVRCHTACELFDAETDGCSQRTSSALQAARVLLQRAAAQFPDMEAGLEAVQDLEAAEEGASQ